MKTRDRLKFQKRLVTDLMDWSFADMGYQADLKEFNIHNDRIKLPFYASSSRGPFFTLEPSIRFNNDSYIKEINNVITNPILQNGIFPFGKGLDEYFNNSNILTTAEQEHVQVRVKKYYLKIFSNDDYTLTFSWLKKYIDEIGWRLIDKLKSDESIFNFYVDVFHKQNKKMEGKTFSEILEIEFLPLDHTAVITMIYLGLKNGFPDTSQIVDWGLQKKKESIIYKATEQLKKHFKR